MTSYPDFKDSVTKDGHVVALRFHGYSLVFWPEEDAAKNILNLWHLHGHQNAFAWLEVWCASQLGDTNTLVKITEMHPPHEWQLNGQWMEFGCFRVTDGVQSMSVDEWYKLYGA